MYLHWRHEGNSGSASYLGNQLARCDSVPDKAYTPERSAARRTSWIYWQFFCNPAWSHSPRHLLSPLKERLAERSNKPSQTFFLTHSWPVCYHRIPCDLQRCTAHALPVNESHKFKAEASLSMPVAIFFDTSWHKRTAGSLGCATTPSILLCTKHVTWTSLMIDWTRAGALAALALDCTWTNDTKRPCPMQRPASWRARSEDMKKYLWQHRRCSYPDWSQNRQNAYACAQLRTPMG